MEQYTNFLLEDIDPNPWQPRDGEDPEHIKKLAISIGTEGLLQVPVGRPVGRDTDNLRVQLAFGHSRLAAFKFLQDTGNIGFDRMPVIVRELSDEEMFRLAISENLQRRDLTPMEEAKAMNVYRTQFGKTSAEIGTLFGMSESAVRNKIRLLDLPAEAGQALDKGQITENFARRVLSLHGIVKPAAIVEIVDTVKNGSYDKPSQVDQLIVDRVTKDPNVKRFCYSYEEEKGLAAGLWPLDAEFGMALSNPTLNQVKKILGEEALAGIQDAKTEYETAIVYMTAGKMTVAEAITNQVDPEMARAVEQLLRPPACSKCPFLLRLGGGVYCGKKMCFERKVAAWTELELQRVSTETGIPIYQPITDGQVFEESENWNSRTDWFKREFKQKAEHLRLRGAKNNGYYGYICTDSKVVQLISISEDSQKRVSDGKSKEEREWAEREAAQLERDRKMKNRELARKFCDVVAGPCFGYHMYAGLSLGMLMVQARSIWDHWEIEGEPSPEIRRMTYKVRLGQHLVDRLCGWELDMQGPEAVARHLQGLATEIGLELPENWLEMAQAYGDGLTLDLQKAEGENDLTDEDVEVDDLVIEDEEVME